MIKIMFLSSIFFSVLGTIYKYNNSRFFGAVKGAGFGLFFGMILSFVLYVFNFLEKSAF